MSPIPYVMPNPNNGGPNPPDVNKAQNAFQVAQQANMVSQNFGIPMQGQNPGMWANILPAAIQIEEHKKMNQVALEYQQNYVDNFQRKYGFNDDDLKELRNEFALITDHITGLIPDGELRTMYKKYVESYPHMYLSMIPAEALQSKLAVKCHRDNLKLRKEVQDMSKCVTTLVQSLSKLQMAAGVPPIVNLMFESMPDPLTAITDPMYNAYNEAIKTYHFIADKTQDFGRYSTFKLDSSGKRIPDGTGPGGYKVYDLNRNPDKSVSSMLLSDPVNALEAAMAQFTPGSDIVVERDSSGRVTKKMTPKDVKDLQDVIANMGTSSGCQAYGNEWNHTGPEPPMNPAMCLGPDDVMQPGNPRNAHGRTAVYKAQRTQDGGARWVMKGQVPNHTGQGVNVLDHAQITQSARYHQQPANDWAHYSHAPPVPKTRKTKKSKKRSSKK